MPAFNYPELEQKASRVLHNSNEFVNKWIDFISAPAGNVTLEYYDENGNLQTSTFSNRNKLVQDFIANVNLAMKKTFYVDAVNGDDNNDGSESAPFKTIKKACDSVPVGGSGYIILNSDITVDNYISLIGKVIHIRDDGTKRKIAVSDDGNSWLGRFLLNDAVLSSYNIDWQFGTSGNEIPDAAIYNYRYKSDALHAADLPAYIAFRGGTIECYSLVSIVTNIALLSITLKKMKTYAYFVSLTNRVLALSAFGVSIEDSDSNTLNWDDVISDIVKDANGVPRNIISNIVF